MASDNYCDEIPWVEKYRPNNLDDIISQKHIVHTISSFLQKYKSLPHMIFYGPSGTGKTSTIIACINKLFGNKRFDYLTLNASDERGVDTVRNRIKKFAETQKLFDNSNEHHKIVILDEADSMTEEAQFSLRQLLVNYTNTVRFCIICNYIHKIIPEIQSRCCNFRFIPIQNDYIKKHLINICKLEDIDYSENGLQNIIDMSNGDLRKIINILQTVYLIDKKICYDNVNRITSFPGKDVLSDILYNCSINSNINVTYKICNDIIVQNGYSVSSIFDKLIDFLFNSFLPKELMTMLIFDLSSIERKLALKYYNNNTLFINIISIFYKVIIFLSKYKE